MCGGGSCALDDGTSTSKGSASVGGDSSADGVGDGEETLAGADFRRGVAEALGLAMGRGGLKAWGLGLGRGLGRSGGMKEKKGAVYCNLQTVMFSVAFKVFNRQIKVGLEVCRRYIYRNHFHSYTSMVWLQPIRCGV